MTSERSRPLKRVAALVAAAGLAGCTDANPEYVPFPALDGGPLGGDGGALVDRDLATGMLAGDLAGPLDLAMKPVLEVDVAEDASGWEVGESEDDEIEACDPRRRGKVAIADDPMKKVIGAESIRVTYGPDASSYFQAVFPKSRNAKWDLTRYTAVSFVVDARLPGGFDGWSPPGPTVVLCSKDGHRRFDPQQNLLPRDGNAWVPLTVPFAGGGPWRARDVDRFDPRSVESIEIHADPQRGNGTGSVTLWIDALKFL